MTFWQRAFLAAIYGMLLALVVIVVWFALTVDPLGTCIPGADPAIRLERCEDVQP